MNEDVFPIWGFSNVILVFRGVPLLPYSWKWKIGPFNNSYVSNVAIFHFHDCGRKSRHPESFRPSEITNIMENKQWISSSLLPSRKLTYPPDKAYLKMIFLFPRWDMWVPWRVLITASFCGSRWVWISSIYTSLISSVFFRQKGYRCLLKQWGFSGDFLLGWNCIDPSFGKCVCVFETDVWGKTVKWNWQVPQLRKFKEYDHVVSEVSSWEQLPTISTPPK